MLIPIIGAVLPSIVSLAEKLFSGSGQGDAKKEFVMKIVDALYDKYLAGHIPDLPAIDEKAVIMNIVSIAVDAVSSRLFPASK